MSTFKKWCSVIANCFSAYTICAMVGVVVLVLIEDPEFAGRVATSGAVSALSGVVLKVMSTDWSKM